MNNPVKIDKVDLQILRTLQGNARLTLKELAAQVSLSSTPVFERLKRLENEGSRVRRILQRKAEQNKSGNSNRVYPDHSGHSRGNRVL